MDKFRPKLVVFGSAPVSADCTNWDFARKHQHSNSTRSTSSWQNAHLGSLVWLQIAESRNQNHAQHNTMSVDPISHPCESGPCPNLQDFLASLRWFMKTTILARLPLVYSSGISDSYLTTWVLDKSSCTLWSWMVGLCTNLSCIFCFCRQGLAKGGLVSTGPAEKGFTINFSSCLAWTVFLLGFCHLSIHFSSLLPGSVHHLHPSCCKQSS